MLPLGIRATQMSRLHLFGYALESLLVLAAFFEIVYLVVYLYPSLSNFSSPNFYRSVLALVALAATLTVWPVLSKDVNKNVRGNLIFI